MDGFLEAQVRRREQHPALETSVLSLLQGVWQRINPPGSAESARSRAMSHMGQITLKGHADLELFLQRLGKGRRECQGAFNDVALVSMVEGQAYMQLKKALAANDGAVAKAGKSPTMYELGYSAWLLDHNNAATRTFSALRWSRIISRTIKRNARTLLKMQMPLAEQVER